MNTNFRNLIQRSKSLSATTNISKFLPHHKNTPTTSTTPIQTTAFRPFITTRQPRSSNAKPPSDDKMTPSDIRTYVGIFVLTTFSTFVLLGEDSLGPTDGNGPMKAFDQLMYIFKSSFGDSPEQSQTTTNAGPTEEQLLQFRTFDIPENDQIAIVNNAGSLFGEQQQQQTTNDTNKAAV